MKVEFKPLTTSLIPASHAFNARLHAQITPLFDLPYEASASQTGSCQHYVAVDQNGEVRGGMYLSEQRGWLDNAPVFPLINIQSPLSEGLVDRRFSGIGLQMLKFVAARSVYAYAVGMGGDQNAWPRMLKAAGWHVSLVPFQFTVINSSRFLRQIGAFRKGSRKWLARAASGTGIGSLFLMGWRFAHPTLNVRGYALESAGAWPNGTNPVWEGCRKDLSFSVLRDEPTLDEMYPRSQPRLKRFLLRLHGDIVGWSVGLVTKNLDSAYFGDLVVGTIVDGLAEKKHLPALVALTRDALIEMNAELILTNQTHRDWRVELRRLGFLTGPSNYVLALSKPLAGALGSDASCFDRMHVNRGDGDGRNHL